MPAQAIDQPAPSYGNRMCSNASSGKLSAAGVRTFDAVGDMPRYSPVSHTLQKTLERIVRWLVAQAFPSLSSERTHSLGSPNGTGTMVLIQCS